jgi:hypothetical protein
MGQLNTIRLTAMRLVAVPGLESELASMADNALVPLLITDRPNTTVVLEDCTFEAAFDSLTLDRVVACLAVEGAHVGSLYMEGCRAQGLARITSSATRWTATNLE